MSRSNRRRRRSTAAEFILRQSLRDAHTGWSRLVRRSAGAARRLLILVWDPTVLVDVRGTKLLMPFSHDLPIYLNRFPLYGTNLALLAKAVEQDSLADGRRFMIDVGANVGDSAAIVSAKSTLPILCIEPHLGFSSYLEANRPQLRNIAAIDKVVLGSGQETPTGRWETERGTARFFYGPGAATPVANLTEIVESRDLGNPRILKIDTDGADLPIIVSERQFLASWRPVLFFEYDPTFYRAGPGLVEILEYLRGLGYERLMCFDNYGGLISAINLAEETRVMEIASYANTLAVRGDFLDVCVFHEQDRTVAESYDGMVRDNQELVHK